MNGFDDEASLAFRGAATDDIDGRAREPLGVSSFLPPCAAQALVRAARKARGLPDGSKERAKVIEEAVCRVKEGYGAFFVQGGHRCQ